MYTIQPTVCPLKHVHTCNLLSCSCSLLARFRSAEDIGSICQPDKWTYLYRTKEKRDCQEHSVPGTARDVTATTIIITLPPVIGKFILMWEGCLRIQVHNCVRVTIEFGSEIKNTRKILDTGCDIVWGGMRMICVCSHNEMPHQYLIDPLGYQQCL